MGKNNDDKNEPEEDIEDEEVSEKQNDTNKSEDAPENLEDDAADAGGKRKRKRKRKKKAADPGDESKNNDDGPEAQENDGASKDMVEQTVYVEGMPFDATPDQVKEFFSSKGGIDDIVELRLPTWQDSGRLRGYGHILFESASSYEKALKLSGEHLGKRYLTIQAANSPKNNMEPESTQNNDPPPTDCRTLFVNNLPYQAEEVEISKIFEALGVTIPEDGVRIARNSVTRQSKGFCYIDLESPKDAQKIMASTKRLTIKGRLLRLDWDTGRMKGSYRHESGRLWTKEVKEKEKQDQKRSRFSRNK
jgi:nucleolin